MRIVIDLQGTQTESRYRGIGRYVRSITKSIVTNRGEHEVVLALNGLFPQSIESIRSEFDGLLPQENIRVLYAPGPVCECAIENAWRSKAAKAFREAVLASIAPDVVFVPSFFEDGYTGNAVTSIGRGPKPIPTVVTVHDLIPLQRKEQYLDVDSGYRDYYLQKVNDLYQSSCVLGISESSCREVRDAFGFQPDRVVNASEGASEMFRPVELDMDAAAELRSRLGIGRPFVMYAGGADERKNLHGLISAYARLPAALRDTHQLVLAGKIPESSVQALCETAKAQGLQEDEWRVTGHVTDQELVYLYNLSRAFVFPSRHEGFGLPALEAMACGTPVIGSATSSIPEVIGRQDALFDPDSEDEIADRMTRVLEDSEFRRSLIDSGLARAKGFTWDASARAALTVMERVAGETGDLCRSDISSTVDLSTQELLNQLRAIELKPTREDLLAAASAVSENFPSVSGRQLLVDVSELSQRDARTGIQRVVRRVFRELVEEPPVGYEVKPVYATPGSTGYRYAHAFWSANVDASAEAIDDEYIETAPGDVFLGLDLQHHAVIENASELRHLRTKGVAVYHVVFDLLPVQLPDAFADGASELHAKWLRVIGQSDGAICISRAVADELYGWMVENGPERLRPFRIGWFHLGADLDGAEERSVVSPASDDLPSEIARRPFFLMVGTVEPRKRHAQALDAFETLWANGLDANLVIVGKQGWKVDALAKRMRNHSEFNRRLHWLEGIGDDRLERLYQSATALLMASEGEGFGLPLIEAAHHRLPIIARDIPVFREIVGDRAYYFSGTNAVDLARAVESWRKADDGDKDQQPDGMPWLSWSESAEQLKQVLFGEQWYRVSNCCCQSRPEDA